MGKQKAAEIRKQLKTLGYSARDVSVRSDHNSLDITIRRNGLNVKAVKAIANSYENVSRCEASGEILSGGNTYVTVGFADDVWDAMTQFVKKLANDAGLQAKGWARFTVGEHEYEISVGEDCVRIVRWDGNDIGSNMGGWVWSVDQAVAAVVNHQLNAE
jgi:hypothetical protein